MLVIGQCIRTVNRIFTRHACVSGQNASCARAVVLHFAELTDFFFMKTCNRCLASFSSFD